MKCRDDPEVLFHNPSVIEKVVSQSVDPSPTISECVSCSIRVDVNGGHAVSSVVCFIGPSCFIV